MGVRSLTMSEDALVVSLLLLLLFPAFRGCLHGDEFISIGHFQNHMLKNKQTNKQLWLHEVVILPEVGRRRTREARRVLRSLPC